MKRVSSFWAIVLFSVGLAIGQAKGKATIRKPVSVSKRAEANQGWIPFWSQFGNVIRRRDYEALKSMMVVKDFDCWMGDKPNSLDPKDRCIADGRSSKGGDYEVTWNDVSNLISSRTFFRIYKADPDGREYVQDG